MLPYSAKHCDEWPAQAAQPNLHAPTAHRDIPGRLAEAELHYRAALTNGAHATAAYNLGVVLEDRRRPADAVAAYRLAIEADPRFPDAHYNLSRLYEQLGDKTSALRHLKSYRALTRGGGRA